MEPVVFKSTVDKRNRIITLIVMASLVAAMLLFWFTTPAHTAARYFPSAVMLLICIGTPVIIYGNLPRRIEVTPEAVVLKCPFRNKTIPRNAKTEVRRVRDTDVQNLLRNWGADGIFGKYGLFASKRYSRMHFYAKRGKRDWILVKNAAKVYVIAPDDGEGFLKLFQ